MNDNQSAFNSDNYNKEIKRTLPFYEEFYNQISQTVNLYKPKTALLWLDVGCGTGKMAETAFNTNNIKQFVFCDSSPDMIEKSKKYFNSPYCEFIVSDLLQLEFNNEFDVVTSVQVNHYLKYIAERKIALKNFFNALKPNGMFFCFENFKPFSDVGTRLYLERWKNFQCNNGKSETEAEKHINRYNRNYFPITISENLNLMKECGFKSVEILWLSYMQVGFAAIK